jgi:hypothetical protein
MGGIVVACRIVVTKSEEKIPLRKFKRKWEKNIKMKLREIWLEGVD